ncbi:alpha/beta fold hydrolase [Auraticoccus monumenti]|uniref:Pimeloyl-ACP methyl ester carboxylesterase n=1 Tax=Auraticoccus monumenti TaxID=675864 RepID=A0A1G6WIS6_9ACTN|nr:alpha/beta hydrolase [Auraticoccus monumenti]SDD65860.1 Pimeloyl-ACP methyl ester carboxylesterase [Auraticoccus monumenti]
MVIHYRQRVVDGHRLHYQESGPADAPVIVLLHGYPTSSFMFRRLIPLLATRCRVIAPDHLGFGFSDAPPVEDFEYSFDALADLTRGLLEQLGVDRYAIYVQDYGAPIGWRLALADPDHVTAVVSQNGNAYEDGFVEDFWAPIWRYAEDAGAEAELRPALGIDAIRWQYTHGVPDPETVDPETWHHDTALVSRPGNDRVQLALFADYVSNVALYPEVQRWFRESQVPLLAVWGRNDEIFAPAGATAFSRDLPDAQVELLDGGHFLLESHLDEVATLVLDLLDRVTPGRAA